MKNYFKGLLNIKRINKYKDLPKDQCAICKESKGDTDTPCPIHIPYITNCGHIFCYYCIKSEMINSSGNEKKSMYMCPRCSNIVSDIEPYYHYDDDDDDDDSEEERGGENDGSSSSSEDDDEIEEGIVEEIDYHESDDETTNLIHRRKY
ncbi:hypothetical protein PIROE2DRAFT_58620 [Piromyces sp. E2]|nr:hypothetical protein PIROE2DRAFT_58620 [Piromyces sp. E2]|eukprot:OUM67669.1 hypothetical protein PIROE2DRAFT_58620 [Piromyces sp. E2]